MGVSAMGTARRRLVAAACFLALLLCAGGALCATDALAPFFDKVKDKGAPVEARAFKDGTAQIDVCVDGKVTRWRVDKEGKVVTVPSLKEYRKEVLDKLKKSAADAAAAAARRDYPKDAEVRAVLLVVEEDVTDYAAAAYDKTGKFLGWNFFTVDALRWDGWTDAVGEVDPLAEKK